jgi:hypothetical protein
MQRSQSPARLCAPAYRPTVQAPSSPPFKRINRCKSSIPHVAKSSRSPSHWPSAAEPPRRTPPLRRARGKRKRASRELAITWVGTGDYAGAILSRADDLNAQLLHEQFSTGFDNIDVYRLMHLTLFGQLLDDPVDTKAIPR